MSLVQLLITRPVQLLIMRSILMQKFKQLIWAILSTLQGFVLFRAALHNKGTVVWAAEANSHFAWYLPATWFILLAHSNRSSPLLSVTSMTILSFGPGPLRLEEEPSVSSGPGTGVPPLALELGELERLSKVGVAQGVRLGLRRRVRTVRVTTPFLSC